MAKSSNNLTEFTGGTVTNSNGTITFNPPVYTGLFSSFNPTQDIVTNVVDNITEQVWSSGVTAGLLTSSYISTAQSNSSGIYYLDIYQSDPATVSNAEVQYSIAYGNYYGSGSAQVSSSYYPTQTTYYQYRNVLLPASSDKFVTADGTVMNSITIVNFKRERLKEELNPGGWELRLKGITGTNLSLIDDYSTKPLGTETDGGLVYNIVSGSITNGVYGGTNPIYYGLSYPQSGILVLDSAHVSQSANIPYSSGSAVNNNIVTFNAIHSASYFSARNYQTINSTYYFVRVLNNMFNYSNNPSFTTGSLGDLRYADMISDPKVYITTVGLYNDNNELLAVAKVSQPLQKAFNQEATLRIRLDF